MASRKDNGNNVKANLAQLIQGIASTSRNYTATTNRVLGPKEIQRNKDLYAMVSKPFLYNVQIDPDFAAKFDSPISYVLPDENKRNKPNVSASTSKFVSPISCFRSDGNKATNAEMTTNAKSAILQDSTSLLTQQFEERKARKKLSNAERIKRYRQNKKEAANSAATETMEDEERNKEREVRKKLSNAERNKRYRQNKKEAANSAATETMEDEERNKEREVRNKLSNAERNKRYRQNKKEAANSAATETMEDEERNKEREVRNKLSNAERNKRYRQNKKEAANSAATETMEDEERNKEREVRNKLSNAERNKRYRQNKKEAANSAATETMEDEERNKEREVRNKLSNAERNKRYRQNKKEAANSAATETMEDEERNKEREVRNKLSNAERNKRYRQNKKEAANSAATETMEDEERNKEREVRNKLSNAERNKRYRQRNRENEETTSQEMETGDTIPVKRLNIVPNADREFNKRFTQNKFGYPCDVCDRLWFYNDLSACPEKGYEILRVHFKCNDVENFKVCNSCKASLNSKRLPTLSVTNGFVYPPIPSHLPPLDLISERLISPRLPFMHIRRLRAYGSKALMGQIVNVPIDVDETVTLLPRYLNDDYAFNVNIKRHQIHKSAYLSGYITKSVIKKWLQYLLGTELYKLYGIKVNENFFKPSLEDPLEGDEESHSPIVEEINEKHNDAKEFLFAKQQTLLWSEEKYLDIAPSMKQPVISLLYDEHAEELSFPSIYFGTARKFKVNVTPYMVASSEIRRSDRRGVTPEHVLYMAAKIMRFRLRENIAQTFIANDNVKSFTKKDLDDSKFLQNCLDQNLMFLKSIPNSCQYWYSRKKDLFAMIRQLGKPTMFLTLSCSEYSWPYLLHLLYRLKFNKDYEGETAIESLNADFRTTLVNEDPVTCCVYFDKLVDVIMNILKHSKCSPFGKYHVKDFFKRIEFQQRGSPHAHILLWLENDPQEEIGENMPGTIDLVDTLCSVNPNELQVPRLQTHKHTFTCYKKIVQNEENKQCRFGAPFWPVEETVVLLPLPVTDTRRQRLRLKYYEMHQSLEFEDFETLEEFFNRHKVRSYNDYLNILRAGIARPRLFVRRTIHQKFINLFNPWIAEKLQSNMDIQFILEEFSCATYVVEYVNKTNRGISNLQRELIKLRDEYPDVDYGDLIKSLGTKILNSFEISSQEAAWYLLGLHMSESSRKVEYIQTVWPYERSLVKKSKDQIDDENLPDQSTAIWKETLVEKYENRPRELESVTMAQFHSEWYQGVDKQYKQRKFRKVIRYRNYEISDISNYKREMVLLHVPFRSEENDVLNDNKFLTIYDDQEDVILKRRKDFESKLNIDLVMEECRRLMIDEMENVEEKQQTSFVTDIVDDHDFLTVARDSENDDIMKHNMERLPGVVRKRENVMTAEEFCKAMRSSNELQRKLLLDLIYRLYTPNQNPLQIFLTGPAGCGKTWLLKLMMECFNRFSQTHNNLQNAYIAAASTGMAAAAINGLTVHSVFRISNSAKTTGFSTEALQLYRSLMRNIKAVFIDECSMIGSGILNQVNQRLQQILQEYEKPFGGLNMIFTGDLRQLPPVCQAPIYKRSKQNFCAEIVWRSLQYYPLEQVMRQADVLFSTILTKIGDGIPLEDKEKELLESRFVTREDAKILAPNAIRLFFNTFDVCNYNKSIITGSDVIDFVATDCYTGTTSAEQLRSARQKVHRLKPEETGGLPYLLHLQLNRPYMLRANVDVSDGLVNGVIGWLKYVECDPNDETVIKRLWFQFESERVGRMLRLKCKGLKATNTQLKASWVPITKRTATIALKSKIVSCKRTQFPVVEACAITIHKSQGGTYQQVVYDYKKTHDQQLVYVALSRATSIHGLFLTNSSDDFNFYHAKGRKNQELQSEFWRLKQNKLTTIVDKVKAFLEPAATSFWTFNVQSLSAHCVDLISDPLLSSCTYLLLNETWNNDETEIPIRGYRFINQFKRKMNRSGGVAIYGKEEETQEATSYETYKYEKNKVELVSVKQDDVGDICAVKTEINGAETLVIAVYISSNATTDKIHKFLTFNLMAYSPKLKGLFKYCDEEKLYDLPIIIGGDFNTSLEAKDKYGQDVSTFMKENFDLDLINNSAIGTTKTGTCIDGVFSRYVNVDTRDYISYFSYHKPLLSVIKE